MFKRGMRITFVLPFYPLQPVGGYRVVYEYANQLVARGHDVSVVHAERSGDPLEAESSLSKRARLLTKRLARIVRGRPEVPTVDWQHIDSRVRMLFVPNLKPRHIPAGDVLVATAWRTAGPVSDCGPEKGAKFYLIQHHETWDGDESAVNATWRLPLKKIVIARWLERLALELGVPPSEVQYIPNGIDGAVFRLTSAIASRPKRVATLCHEAEWKGVRDGIAALELARVAVPDLQAVMFGTMLRPDWVPDWIEYRHDPAQVDLVREVYNGSSIYLCPSRGEGWHLPPAEAMACGCAVVSTEIDGVADYALDGETALLAPVRQPEALSLCLVGLLHDDERRMKLAQAGLENIGRFTWQAAADSLERWFAESTEGRISEQGGGECATQR